MAESHETKPTDLVFVRHGLSEGNLVQRSFKEGSGMDIPPEFYNLHDSHYRLAAEGVAQAEATGEWLVEQFGGDIENVFEGRYVSPHLRAIETAMLLGGRTCTWLVDSRITERDWGVYNTVHPTERQKIFPHSTRMREISSLYWRPDGGESLASEVQRRYRDWQETVYREQAGKKVIAVTHGELMWVARFVIERMLPIEWEAADADKSQRIFNTAVIHYTRTNPDNPEEMSSTLPSGWRRIVCPWDPEASPFGGKWVKLPGKRLFSGAQLHELVEQRAKIFEGILLKDVVKPVQLEATSEESN